MALNLTLNGQQRTFGSDGSSTDSSLAGLVAALGLKADRVALELNGTIVPRGSWAATNLSDGDRIELVHFVGGGLDRLGTNYSAPRYERA